MLRCIINFGDSPGAQLPGGSRPQRPGLVLVAIARTALLGTHTTAPGALWGQGCLLCGSPASSPPSSPSSPLIFYFYFYFPNENSPGKKKKGSGGEWEKQH